MAQNTSGADDIEALAEAVGVLRRIRLSYDQPIYSCSQCGTPCSGVMCLSCATR